MLDKKIILEMIKKWKQYDSTTILHLYVIVTDTVENIVIDRSKKLYIQQGIINYKCNYKNFINFMKLNVKKEYGSVYKFYKWNKLIKNRSVEDICNKLYRDIKIGKNKLKIKQIDKDFYEI